MPTLLSRLIVVAALLLVLAPPALADDYPNRPVRLIIPFPPGGSNDVVGRLVAQQLSTKLGQQVYVDNRAGAGGTIGTETCANSPPDGYTICVISIAHAVNPALYTLKYDPIKSFTPLAFVGVVPSLLVVSAQSKIGSVADLLAEAKQKSLSYGSAGPGTTMNIAAELFNSVTGIRTTHVPYRGAGPALNDLLGGHLDLIIADTPVLLPLVNTNAVLPLALFATERSPLIPTVATTAQLGYPEIVMENWYGVLGPIGLTPSVRTTLEKAILEVLASPAVKERFAAGGLQGARDSEGFKARLASDVAYWRPAVKKLGISAE